jgi:CBS domain containing-hemolysin-like protein
MSDIVKVLLSIALVALNGFFVAAEFALIRVRRTRVEELADEGNAAAKAVLAILGRLDTYLAATQLGITMVNLCLGWIGEPVMQHLLQPFFARLPAITASATVTISVIAGFAVITVVEVVFGELLPKWSAIQEPERSAKLVVYPMAVFLRVFYPIILFLKWFASLFAHLMGIDSETVGRLDTAHSEEEIIAIVEHAEQSGTIGQSEAEIVDNVFEFAHTQVREIMVPRVDIVAIDADWPLADAVAAAGASSYTRFPLCAGDRDHIIGMVHIKDLLALATQPRADINSIKREIPAVPETKRIDLLLRELQRRQSHMAVVLDEYGGTAGIVTLEDIVEELVGEIQDEYDRPAPVERFDDGRIAIAGAEPIDTATEELGLTFENSEDFQTLGGYARHILGLSPTPGARTKLGDYTVTVAEAQGQRISRLVFARIDEPEETAGPEAAKD